MGNNRRKPRVAENSRKKIQASAIINRLVNHIDGKVELSATQVRAAEILLNKTLPNLQSQEITKKIKPKKVTAKPLNDDDWAERHSMGTPEGTTARAH